MMKVYGVLCFLLTLAACASQLTESGHTSGTKGGSTEKTGTADTAKAIIGNLIRPKDKNKLRDLVIIVDSSRSITRGKFNNVKQQLAKLIGLFCPNPNPFRKDANHAALINFSTRVQSVFDFAAMKTTAQIQADIINLTFFSAQTCTSKAFEHAQAMFTDPKKGDRKDAKFVNEVLILTDGKANICGGNAAAVKAAKALQQHATVFALMVGVNSPAGQKAIASYVSDPKKHIFSIKHNTLLPLMKLIEKKMKKKKFKCVK